MTTEDLAKLVKQMRDAQKSYFASRNNTNLNISKDWEWCLDKAVEEILNPKSPGLFDEVTK